MAQQSLTLKSIRESIGYNLNDMILVTASTTGDTSSIIALYSLGLGSNDAYNDRQVYASTPVGSIVAGEKSWVSDFDATNKDITVAPVFSAVVAVADVFELWKVFTVEEINDAINQTINDVTGKALQIKQTSAYFTSDSKYIYDVLSGFTHLSKVEYVYSLEEVTIENCETAWTAGTNVTATADTFFVVEGTYGAKLVVAAAAGAAEILAYTSLTSTDLSEYDTIEFSMYSSIALTAGQIQLHLSSTAAIASAEETLDVPAMSAATEYRHSVALANPQSDTAIISVGLYEVSDVGACTLYIDKIRAVKSGSKQYKELPLEYWDVAKGSTNYLSITDRGLIVMSSPTQMRLTGFQIPARMTADTDTAEIDPAYLIAQTTGKLLISHAKSAFLDIHDRANLANYWLGLASKMETRLTPNIPGGTIKI